MMNRRLVAFVAVAIVTPFGLMACGDKSDKSDKSGKSDKSKTASAEPQARATTPASAAPAGPVSLSITPASGAKDLPISTEIGLQLQNGKVASVEVKGADGTVVPGDLREDGSSWVPSRPLAAATRYTATVTANGADGQATTATTRFTTMSTPSRKTGTGLYLFDDHTYGVAMPVVAEFNPGIKKADRAAVQKRMFVTTDPPQPGVWSWTASGTQAYYRAKQFWQPGTTLTVRLAVGGLPTGGGRYGSQDRSATATIGRDLEMTVDNATKQMTVVESGKTIRTMPVSLGKPSTPSSSGTMVVMDKATSTIFDTTDTDGAKGYKMTIAYAQRLTWSGQYIHSAPWSTGAQGHRNVSHGCVNLSPSNASWLFGRTLIGDPITVKGTGDKLQYGNGWTPWDVSWDDFVKASALPVPAALA